MVLPALTDEAFSASPTGLTVLDADGVVMVANRALARILRREPDDLVGLEFAELVHPEDRADLEQVPDLAPGRGRDFGRKRMLRPDGSDAWVGIAMARSSRDAGEGHLVVHVLDLHDLIKAESRLVSVIDGLGDGVVVLDSHGRVVSANKAAQRLLVGESELVGVEMFDPPWSVLGEDREPLARESRPELRALAGGRPVLMTIGIEVEAAGKRASERNGTEPEDLDGVDGGGVRWLAVGAHPIERANGQFIIVTHYRDVSERRRMEEAIQVHEATDRAKSEFLSRMSHELRTPLNSVLGFAQLLQMEDLPSHQEEAVQHILGAGRHLLGLLDEVLDLEQIEHGRLQVRLESVAVGPALQEAVELVQPLAVASGVAIDLKMGRSASLHVVADPQRLRQVMLNLLTNGVKYNRAHGRVTVWCDAEASALVVRVRDTGHGIAAQHFERIFTPFERLDADRRGIEGAGVGLALSKRLVEAMGGAIGVESDVGQGSTFWFALRTTPAVAPVPTVPAPIEAEAAVDVLRRTEPARRRLLCIEDNAANRALIELVVRLHGGLDLETAGLGVDGLELARDHPPDAILLDLHLPDRPGEDVMRDLRADPATSATPVIVVTADATPARRTRLLDAGAVAYLTKPIDVPALFTALETALER